jgi:hypothetical protein
MLTDLEIVAVGAASRPDSCSFTRAGGEVL